MLRKKLFTLACAAAILASGACFLPPPRSRPPTPPMIDLDGSRSICVVAGNLTTTMHIDPAQLSQSVADRINQREQGTGIAARACTGSLTNDTVLRIAIVDESARSEPSSSTRASEWTLSVAIDATLSAANGAVLRSVNHWVCTSPSRRLPSSIADPWDHPAFQGWKEGDLGTRLMLHMMSPLIEGTR